MKTRILVGVICVPLLVAAFVFAPPWVTVVVTAAICVVSAWEFVRASGKEKVKIWACAAMCFAAAMPYFVYIYPYRNGAEKNRWIVALMYGILTVGFLLFTLKVASAHKRSKQAELTVLQFAVLSGVAFPLFLATLVDLRINPDHGNLLILLPILCAFITDAGAYFIGVFFGKRRPFPRVSPKKSVEGFIGGIVIGSLSVVIYGIFLRSRGVKISLPALSFAGFAGALATEIGDLVFSLIKRDRGIKDYGALLPGHGGMLDRFDSMVFAAPVMWAILKLLQ